MWTNNGYRQARLWVFIPIELASMLSQLVSKLPNVGDALNQMPALKITHLEEVVPWKYASWNRDHHDEADA